MSIEETARGLADNAVLQVLSRLSMLAMPLLVGFVMWLGGSWVEQRFTIADSLVTTQIMPLNGRVQALEENLRSAAEQSTKIQDRLAAIETRQTTTELNLKAGNDARERFQVEISQSVKDLKDDTRTATNALALKMDRLLDQQGSILQSLGAVTQAMRSNTSAAIHGNAP